MSRRSAFKMTYAPLLNRAALSPAAVVERMADDMRVFAANGAAVTEQDLELLGFTPAQIAGHARNAARRAQALSVR